MKYTSLFFKIIASAAIFFVLCIEDYTSFKSFLFTIFVCALIAFVGFYIAKCIDEYEE